MHIIIPARYASTRLPGKPLLDIGGKPMIQHVYERARESGAESVTIATDDERIRQACERFGARVCLTGAQHRSGTERLAEAITLLAIAPDDIVVNVQGDEPVIAPALIRRVGKALATQPIAVVATACVPIQDEAEFLAPNVVKVVCDKNGFALYFTRAAVPHARDGGTVPALAARHIGIYAYRAGFVARYVALAPSPLEEIEQLEQLRVLWHGERIVVCSVPLEEAPKVSVDTPADLERARKLLAGRVSV